MIDRMSYSVRNTILGASTLVGVQIIALSAFGQPAVSKTHALMLWAGDVFSAENSQQLTDWYTFSHIIHGFLFYLALWFFFPRTPFLTRLFLAMGIEIAWEITENTPMVIQHYREQALAQGYVGDSILNSVSDVCAMIFGFILAWRLPVWATISLGVFFEAWTGFWIHDNLTLNILGLLNMTPGFIKEWQAGI